MAKWKCEICGNEFDNFHAQGFDNRIYCPLCYFKKENQELKSQLKGTTHCFDEEEHRKLENNWNELKRWLYEDHCLYVPEIARNSTYQKVLEKMYEIEKESNSNEI